MPQRQTNAGHDSREPIARFRLGITEEQPVLVACGLALFLVAVDVVEQAAQLRTLQLMQLSLLPLLRDQLLMRAKYNHHTLTAEAMPIKLAGEGAA
jgi:hypothetical protein